jgi:hypothetical protein
VTAILPPPPSIAVLRGLGLRSGETIELGPSELLWRVHRTTGSHVLAWNRLRTFGPILRFDHHPTPRDEHAGYGIWYGADSPRGALAEAFQSTRVIDTTAGSPFLTALRFVRPLRLVDVSGIKGGTWATRVGGNHAMATAAHGRAQHWARTIHRAYTDIDGIAYRGRFAGSVCIAVFERGESEFPVRPQLSLPLSHPPLMPRIATAAYELGYAVT